MDILSNLTKVKKSVTRSISPENFTGEKGKGGMATEGMGKEPARELGQGWKVSPCINVPGHTEFVLADIEGEGVINHMWCTCFPASWRNLILKVYWDDSEEPSIQSPIGDFFCHGWCERSTLSSLAVTVNPAGGFNCYWQMPFKKRAKFVVENVNDDDIVFYYQIDYELCELPDEIAYFHALWKRTNPVKYKDVYVIADEIKGHGHYVGTYLAWQVNSSNWWGEGEIKFYIDGDKEFPTICGTGTEDYFGGARNFEHPQGQYGIYSTAYQGLHQVILPDNLYKPNMRFGMYRWHLLDPIRFESDLKVTIQALGWKSKHRYLPLQDDIASVCYWYQTKPQQGLKMNCDLDLLEVI